MGTGLERILEPMRNRLVVFFPIALLGCYPEVIDGDRVCVVAEEVDGQHRLVAQAFSDGCESDHEGASLECSIESEGFDAHIQTVFRDGKDPNHACAEPLVTTCTLDVEPGTHTLHYAGDEIALDVPSDAEVCLPDGTAPFGTEG